MSGVQSALEYSKTEGFQTAYPRGILYVQTRIQIEVNVMKKT